MKQNSILVVVSVLVLAIGVGAGYTVGHYNKDASEQTYSGGTYIPFTLNSVRSAKESYADFSTYPGRKKYSSTNLKVSFYYPDDVVERVDESNGTITLLAPGATDNDESSTGGRVVITQEQITTTFSDLVKKDVEAVAGIEGVRSQDISVVGGLPAYHYVSEKSDVTFILHDTVAYRIAAFDSTTVTSTETGDVVNFQETVLDYIKNTLTIQ
jgi:hypothetical protein